MHPPKVISAPSEVLERTRERLTLNDALASTASRTVCGIVLRDPRISLVPRDETVPDEVPQPWVAQFAADRRREAELWTELDSTYEAALALADAKDSAILGKLDVRTRGEASTEAIRLGLAV